MSLMNLAERVASPNSASPSVMIVEDEQIIALELGFCLRELGFEVPEPIASGEQALERVRELRPDLILMDIRLAGELDGIETARQIRASQDVPIVFLTAHSDPATLERAGLVEPHGYLLKPFEDRALAVTIEIAFRKHRAERERRRGEARYLAILQNSRDAIVSTGRDQRIVVFSPGAEAAFGYSADEVIGQPIEMLFAKSDRADFNATVGRLLENPDVSARLRELIGQRKTGEAFPSEASLFRFAFEDEVLVTAFLRDVTERQRLEGELQRTQKMESLGLLAGGIAHDFNNLLAALLLYAGLLSEEMEEGSRAAIEVADIIKTAQRGAELTRQLALFGRGPARRGSAVPNEQIRALEQFFRRVIEEDLSIELDLAPEVAGALIPHEQLEQIVTNLVLNARDASPSGGRVLIRTRPVWFDNIDELPRGNMNIGRYVLLSVADTGLGMSLETAARAFEPYFTTKGEHEGTGLGLATVYGIATRCGGHASIVSVEGEGTIVEVLLPHQDLEAQEEGEPPSPRRRPGGASVLIVEDDKLLRRALSKSLRQAGYQVLVAANGEQALQLCAEKRDEIDLILTDLVMPGIDGVAFAEELRARGLCPDAQLLFMSGYFQDVLDRKKLLVRGAVLEKPFAIAQLLSRLEALLDDT